MSRPPPSPGKLNCSSDISPPTPFEVYYFLAFDKVEWVTLTLFIVFYCNQNHNCFQEQDALTLVLQTLVVVSKFVLGGHFTAVATPPSHL